MGWIILIFVIVIFVVAIMSANKKQKEMENRGKAINQTISQMPDFNPTTKIIGPQNRFVFAVDYSTHKILYMPGSVKYFYSFEDVISVELIEDNNIISKKSTGRTIGGALVGGFVAGGVGAIVGGLSGSSKQQNLHLSVKTKLLLRNNASPSVEIPCFDCRTMTTEGKPVKDGSTEYNIYKQGLSCAQRIVDSVSVIIDMVDRESNSSVQGSANSSNISNRENMNKPVMPQSDPLEDEVRRLKAAGQLIPAVKLVVDTLGLGLADAKAYVDNVQ